VKFSKIFLPNQIILRDEIKAKEIDGHVTRMEEKRNAETVGRETYRKEITWKSYA
jgi:hypothetical protein